jgi:hypothetical protein
LGDFQPAAIPLFNSSGELLNDGNTQSITVYSFPKPVEENVFYEILAALPVRVLNTSIDAFVSFPLMMICTLLFSIISLQYNGKKLKPLVKSRFEFTLLQLSGGDSEDSRSATGFPAKRVDPTCIPLKQPKKILDLASLEKKSDDQPVCWFYILQ